MREIKFRGWGISHWRYGSLVIKDYIIIALFDKGRVFEYPVEEENVGQYTGLKDDDGKEIYDGDILIVQGDQNALVKWNKYCCAFNLEINGMNYLLEWNVNVKNYLKIVGNIY